MAVIGSAAAAARPAGRFFRRRNHRESGPWQQQLQQRPTKQPEKVRMRSTKPAMIPYVSAINSLRDVKGTAAVEAGGRKAVVGGGRKVHSAGARTGRTSTS